MKKIVKAHYFAEPMLLWVKHTVAICFLGFAIGGLTAYQVWQEPLEIARPDNLVYNGLTITGNDHTYAVTWSELTQGGIRRQFFQIYNSQNQPLIENPMLSLNIGPYEIDFLVQLSNGDYLLGQRFGYSESFFRIDQQGNYLGLFCSFYRNNSAKITKIEPDAHGGMWVNIYESVGIGSYETHYNRIRHFNAAGVQFSAQGLVLFGTDTNSNDLNFLVQPDDTILCGVIYNLQLHLVRVTEAGQISWDRTINTDVGSVSSVRVFQDDNGDLIWIYKNYVSYEDQSYIARKTDIQGVSLWQSPVTLYICNPNRISTYWNAAILGDDSVVFAAYGGTSTQESIQVVAQRISNQGNTLFENTNIQFTSLDAYHNPSYIEVIPNDSLGAWICLRKDEYCARNQEAWCCYTNYAGYAWTNVLSIMSTPTLYGLTEHIPFFTKNGDNLMMISQANVSGASRINRYDVSATGTISSTILQEGKTALLKHPSTLPLGENVFTAWIEDSEPYYLPNNHDKVAYQIISPSGVKLMPQNAEILSGGQLTKLTYLKAANTHDGNVLLWWICSDIMQIRAQLIDASGNQLWEQGGKLIYSGTNIDKYSPVIASIGQDDIIFCWAGINGLEIRGQRLLLGVPIWETEGHLMVSTSQFSDGSVYKIEPQALDGDYLVYTTRRYNPGTVLKSIYVIQFDTTGSPCPQFVPLGKPAFTIEGYPSSYFYYNLSYRGSYRSNQGLVILAVITEGISEPDWGTTSEIGGYLQILSPDGMLIHGSTGLGLCSLSKLLIGKDNFIYCTTGDLAHIVKTNGYYQISWVIHSCTDLITATEIQPDQFMAISPIKYCLFTAQAGFVEYEDSQFHDYYDYQETISLFFPRIIANGGCAYLTTVSNGPSFFGYSSINTDYATPFILLQKLSSVPTSIDDTYTPSLNNLFAVTCSPNPFNDRTNLKIVAKQNSQSRISIYNLRGQLVKSYDYRLTKGDNVVEWDGRDSEGSKVSAGVYFCRVKAAGERGITKKMIKL